MAKKPITKEIKYNNDKKESSKPSAKSKPKTEPKKEYRNDRVLIISILVIIGVFALILLSINSDKKNAVQEELTPELQVVNYSGYLFEKHGVAWITILTVRNEAKQWIREFEFSSHFNPYEVEHIPTIRNTKNESAAKFSFRRASHTWITVDPNYPGSVVLGGVEIAKVLGQIYEKSVKVAISKPHESSSEPIITCANATNNHLVVDLRLGNETKIFEHEGCIVVQGSDPVELLKASDRLAFELLDVLE